VTFNVDDPVVSTGFDPDIPEGIHGVIEIVDEEDEILPYFVWFANGYREWMTDEEIRAVGVEDE
jgi:hypothetical protein